MRKIVIVAVLLASGCATPTRQKVEPVPQLSESEQYMAQGYKLLSSRRTKKAIAEFDKVIDLCDSRYSSTKKKAYTARSMDETLYYMLKAADEQQNAIVVDPVCSEALYLKGYASLDLGQLDVSEKLLNRAVEMAPVNAKYLSELGHIYHVRREWRPALEIFTRAEDAAETFSPSEFRQQELAQAKRGIGFSLIELGRLDEAEAKFKECLQLDTSDKSAMRELKYIEHLRKKGTGNHE